MIKPMHMLAIACILLGALHLYLWYPGVMDWDAKAIAKMAESGEYTDWFPPAFIALWAVTGRFGSNPGSIYLLQTALLVAGIYLLGKAFLDRRRPGLAAVVVALLAIPTFSYIYHEAIKDTVMGAALTCLAGLSAYLLANPPEGRTRVVTFGSAVALSALALATRHNAIFAVLPLLVLAIYAVIGRFRLLAVSAVTVVALMVGMSFINQVVLQPLYTPTMTALVEFDVAGVLSRSPEVSTSFVPTEKGREEIKRCYDRAAWDYQVRENCNAAELGTHVWESYTTDPGAALREWLEVIKSAPLAYAQHRLAYFAALLRLRCDNCDDEPGIGLRDATQNPAPISPPALAFEYEGVAVPFLLTVHPWIVLLAIVALMLWALFAAWKGEGDRLTLFVFVLSLSSVLYTAAYLIVGIADAFRYLYWLYNGAAIATIAALSQVGLLKVTTVFRG
jgi:hypothetical protein